jgi:hypothetical protein
MINAPVLTAMIEPLDSEVLVKRLFKVAEILSRQPADHHEEPVSSKKTSKNMRSKKSGIVELKKGSSIRSGDLFKWQTIGSRKEHQSHLSQVGRCICERAVTRIKNQRCHVRGSGLLSKKTS